MMHHTKRTADRSASKSHAFLIELTIAILVFALAAAIALGLFVKADQTSSRSQLTTIALAISQSIAEQVKASESPAQSYQALVSTTGPTQSTKSRPASEAILYFDQNGDLVQKQAEAAFQIRTLLKQENQPAGTMVTVNILAAATDSNVKEPLITLTVKKYFPGEEAAR